MQLRSGWSKPSPDVVWTCARPVQTCSIPTAQSSARGFCSGTSTHTAAPREVVEAGSRVVGQRVGAYELVTVRAQHEAAILEFTAHRGQGREGLVQHRLQAEDGCLQCSEIVGKRGPKQTTIRGRCRRDGARSIRGEERGEWNTKCGAFGLDIGTLGRASTHAMLGEVWPKGTTTVHYFSINLRQSFWLGKDWGRSGPEGPAPLQRGLHRTITTGCGRPRPSPRGRRTRCFRHAEWCTNPTSDRSTGRCATRRRAGCCWTSC